LPGIALDSSRLEYLLWKLPKLTGADVIFPRSGQPPPSRSHAPILPQSSWALRSASTAHFPRSWYDLCLDILTASINFVCCAYILGFQPFARHDWQKIASRLGHGLHASFTVWEISMLAPVFDFIEQIREL
jgi:hypothetical protein